ncbi:hypothetical protein [Klebsiella variicola]|uniref:hypothetical protein n=1 Tax=Klebsiella variicola TaxID=244366 RepID=UPI0013D3B0A9|nr:hypothetical protein [Klebsiella variicola]
MHIPSQHIKEAMSAEKASLWFVPAVGNDDVAFLIKAPSLILKSIVNGCSVELVISVKDDLIYCAIKINDIPGSPVWISKVLQQEDDISSLIKILKYKKTPVFLFNELDISVSWADLTINNETHSILEKIKNARHTPLRKNKITVKAIHDYFDEININSPNLSTNELTHEFPFTCNDWYTTQNHFIGFNESKIIDIFSLDEGGNFENTIWSSLESVFPYTLYASPQVKIGDKKRELTDILAFYPNASFFIEAKDTSIFNSSPMKNMQRRTSNLHKQVKKAIDQLVGAIKAAKRGCEIYNTAGDVINPVLTHTHCIVLISEMNHQGNWSDIVNKLLRASSDTGEYFHLLDLEDLIFLLKRCNSDIRLIDYNLRQRFITFVENKSVHIKMR